MNSSGERAERPQTHFCVSGEGIRSLDPNLGKVTVDVLRHSFAAAAAGMGYSELTIAGLLGHRLSGITVRYAHAPDAALAAAADRVAARIEAALEGRASAEVVPLTGGSKDGAEQADSPFHSIRSPS